MIDNRKHKLNIKKKTDYQKYHNSPPVKKKKRANRANDYILLEDDNSIEKKDSVGQSSGSKQSSNADKPPLHFKV